MLNPAIIFISLEGFFTPSSATDIVLIVNSGNINISNQSTHFILFTTVVPFIGVPPPAPSPLVLLQANVFSPSPQPTRMSGL